MAFTSVTKPTQGEATKKSLADILIDNDTHLYNALGGSGGSAMNTVPNASFENDVDADGIPDGWTQTLYTGGAGVIVSTDSSDAESCYKFTHPGGAGNGGGYLTSDYITWSPHRMLGIATMLKCSVAGIKVIVRVKFYDKDKAFLSNMDVYTSTANPLLWTLIYAKNIETPTTARFAKLELHGGVNDTNVAGDVYFDFAQVVDAEPTAGYIAFTDSTINQAEASTSSASYADIGSDISITVPANAKYLRIYTEVKDNTGSNTAFVRWRIGTTYSTEHMGAQGTTYDGAWLSLDVSALQGAQTLRMQAYAISGTAYGKSPSANLKCCKAGRIVCDAVLGTQTMDVS